MTGGNITAGPSSVGAIAGGTPRVGRGPELDLDDDRSLGERLFQWALILLWLAVAASALGYGLPYTASPSPPAPTPPSMNCSAPPA